MLIFVKLQMKMIKTGLYHTNKMASQSGCAITKSDIWGFYVYIQIHNYILNRFIVHYLIQAGKLELLTENQLAINIDGNFKFVSKGSSCTGVYYLDGMLWGEHNNSFHEPFIYSFIYFTGDINLPLCCNLMFNL